MKNTQPVPNFIFSMTPEELQAYYETSKREFSEKDLAKYLQVEEGLTFEQLMAELEEVIQKAKNQSASQ